VDAARCLNSRLGEVAGAACNLCTTECVVALSAVRAVNQHGQCGRCNICPAYFDITSAVDEKGLPSQKLCPRDAIVRKPIGKSDPEDPANNFYDYVIDEEKCDGCGRCVMKCKEPLGLGSIVLRVRHNRCVDCNRCTISTACPKGALVQVPIAEALAPPAQRRPA
jgi:Na+-translocating ferredoxin:NAD+ oxidoreductase subunit B